MHFLWNNAIYGVEVLKNLAVQRSEGSWDNGKSGLSNVVRRH